MTTPQMILKRGLQILGLAGLLLIIIALLQSFKSNAANTYIPVEASNYTSEENVRVQNIHAPALPKKPDFCGEPIDFSDPDLTERFDREMVVNTFLHSSTILILKKAERYFPIIEKILKEENVPDDMKYLCVAESGLSQVVSPSGAAGMWQFMKETAPTYGLFIDSEIDERYNIDKATHAACKYLKEAKAKFGTWTMAAAAYNAGMEGMMRQINAQNQTSYYDLFLNDETSRYIFRILALKYIIQAPKHYGFHLDDNQFYQPFEYKKITISDSNINWVEFAAQNSINYKTLRYYNPQIRKMGWENKNNISIDIYLPIQP